MEENNTYVKLNMIYDIACVLVEKYNLSITDAIRYIADSSILYSIDKNPDINCSYEPNFYAKLIYDSNKRLEELGIKYRRIK